MAKLPQFSKFKLALLQIKGEKNQLDLFSKVKKMVKEASIKQGAQLVVLPECFNSPYGTQYFKQYAEQIPNGKTCNFLTETAKEANVYLIGGSIPEIDEIDQKIYNTCTVYNPKGELIGKYRKIHLFDIDIPGKITFKESEVLTAGDSITHIQFPFGKIGLGICYDIRFPELATIAREDGCCAMIYPGAFNLTTGPLHWELLARARAVDNQIYVASCSPARDMQASYHAYGHSTIVAPNKNGRKYLTNSNFSGQILATTDENESIIYADIQPQPLQDIRSNIPILNQKRDDVYLKYQN